VLGVLRTERSAGVVEPFLAMALQAAEQWTPAVAVPTQLGRLADVAAVLAEQPEHRSAALRALAASASGEAHFAALDLAADRDVDLAWRVLARRAALGGHDPAAVEALLERDPDPDASVRALGVTAARADDDAKAEAWDQIFRARSVPAGPPLAALARSFWRPVQHELLLPWAQRYLDEVVKLAGGGMLAVGGLARVTFPTTGDAAFLERAQAMAREPDQDPTVRATLLSGADTLERMLRARG
jgi:aminopeptidase N